MRMLKIPIVEIHSGALSDLPRVGERLGSLRMLVVTGPKTQHVAGLHAFAKLRAAGFPADVLVLKRARKRLAEVYRVRDKIRAGAFDTVVAVGGGTVIDVGKLAAAKEGKELIVVPTSASHDGIAASLASIPVGGSYASHKAMIPGAVVADLEIILNSPLRMFHAGCADLIAKLSAYEDWVLAAREKEEEIDQVAVAMTRLPAEYVVHAAQSIREMKRGAVRLVVRGLIVSGLAVDLVGSSRPVSGSEHKFSHALDRLSNHPALHGEQVGVGTILSLFLHDHDWERVQHALDTIGAPTSARTLGLPRDLIAKALVYAARIRPSRYTILEHLKINKETAERAVVKTGVA